MHIEFGALQHFTACKPYSLIFIAKETCFSYPTKKDLFCTHLWRWLISVTLKIYIFTCIHLYIFI